MEKKDSIKVTGNQNSIKVTGNQSVDLDFDPFADWAEDNKVEQYSKAATQLLLKFYWDNQDIFKNPSSTLDDSQANQKLLDAYNYKDSDIYQLVSDAIMTYCTKNGLSDVTEMINQFEIALCESLGINSLEDKIYVYVDDFKDAPTIRTDRDFEDIRDSFVNKIEEQKRKNHGKEFVPRPF